MTSSSSPSSESTIKPSLRPPRAMTRTKILPRRSFQSPAGFRPRRTRGSTWPRSCTTSQSSTTCKSVSWALAISATAFRGIAYSRCSTRNNKALMIARVRGSLSRKLVPCPGRVSNSTVPFNRCRTLRTTSSPTPLPEISVISSAVLKPGRKTRSSISDFDDELVSLVIGIQTDLSHARFPGRFALRRSFQAVSYRVSYDMGKRLRDCVEKALIHVGVLATDDQLRLLVAAFCRISHQSREPTKKLCHRDHAHLHDGALQVV